MTYDDDPWSFELPGASGSRSGLGPAGRPRPLPLDDLIIVPDKGNMGGPGNAAANAGPAAPAGEPERDYE